MNNSEFDNLISILEQIPGIGKRKAYTIAQYFVLNKDTALPVLNDVQSYVHKIKLCQHCRTYVTTDLCAICSQPRNDTLCVIPGVKEMDILEALSIYKGYYWLAHDIEDQTAIDHLQQRVISHKYNEIILALPLSPEGDGFTYILHDMLKSYVDKITTFRCGLPRRSDITTLDPVTLTYAFTDRKEL